MTLAAQNVRGRRSRWDPSERMWASLRIAIEAPERRRYTAEERLPSSLTFRTVAPRQSAKWQAFPSDRRGRLTPFSAAENHGPSEVHVVHAPQD